MAKAQGRGRAEYKMVMVVVVGVLVALHCCSLPASAVTYTVGGSQGWIISVGYSTWAAGQSYKTGDILFFPYASGAHDVVEVDKADYDACSVTTAIASYTDGNTNVTLSTTGTHYFLCSFPGHCSAGMKLAVTVGAGATPAPAPSSSVGTPAPSPAPAPPTSALAPTTAPPASAPTTPVPSPASVGTPTSAPAPAPLSSSSPPSPPSPPPPPSRAASFPSSASLPATLLCLSAALLAL